MAIVEAVFYESTRYPNLEKVWIYSRSKWTSRNVDFPNRDVRAVVPARGIDARYNFWGTQSEFLTNLWSLPQGNTEWVNIRPSRPPADGTDTGGVPQGSMVVRANGNVMAFYDTPGTSDMNLLMLNGTTWTKVNDVPDFVRNVIQGFVIAPAKTEHAYYIVANESLDIRTRFSLPDTANGLCIVKYTPPSTLALTANSLKSIARGDVTTPTAFTAGQFFRIACDEEDNIYMFRPYQANAQDVSHFRFYLLDIPTSTFNATQIGVPRTSTGQPLATRSDDRDNFYVRSTPLPAEPDLEIALSQSDTITSTESYALEVVSPLSLPDEIIADCSEDFTYQIPSPGGITRQLTRASSIYVYRNMSWQRLTRYLITADFPPQRMDVGTYVVNSGIVHITALSNGNPLAAINSDYRSSSNFPQLATFEGGVWKTYRPNYTRIVYGLDFSRQLNKPVMVQYSSFRDGFGYGRLATPGPTRWEPFGAEFRIPLQGSSSILMIAPDGRIVVFRSAFVSFNFLTGVQSTDNGETWSLLRIRDPDPVTPDALRIYGAGTFTADGRMVLVQSSSGTIPPGGLSNDRIPGGRIYAQKEDNTWELLERVEDCIFRGLSLIPQRPVEIGLNVVIGEGPPGSSECQEKINIGLHVRSQIESTEIIRPTEVRGASTPTIYGLAIS